MGYYSVTSGQIEFSPALSQEALENEKITKFLGYDSNSSVYLDVEQQTISGPEDEFKAYWFAAGVKELVSAILEINPETVFNGYIEVHGEGDGEYLDLWRLYVVDGKIKEVEAQIVWPD